MSARGSLAGGTPRNGMPPTKPYVYKGTGMDTLTTGVRLEEYAEPPRRRSAARDGERTVRGGGALHETESAPSAAEEPRPPEAAREPIPPASVRCPKCRYLITSVGHRMSCGGTS